VTTSRKHQRGQAMVEFMLSIVFLVLLIVGMIEMAFFVYTYSVLADSAKEGVRYAIVHGASGTNSTGPTAGSAWSTPWSTCTSSKASTATPVVNVVKQYAIGSFHGTGTMNINVCYPDGTNAAGNAVIVTVNYMYQPFFGLGWPVIQVNASSTGRIVY
jgi:Flp pilus assembly protein TadG